jgi:hypothetical protein
VAQAAEHLLCIPQSNPKKKKKKKRWFLVGHWWLTPIILATQETKIRRFEIQSKPEQIVKKTLSQKIGLSHKNETGGVASKREAIFKPQYGRKKN